MQGHQYIVVEQEPSSTEKTLTQDEVQARSCPLKDVLISPNFLSIALILVLVLSLGIVTIAFMTLHTFQFRALMGLTTPQRSCERPTIRREWRTLTENEQQEFFAAIQCLQQRPSNLGLSAARYDDFVYVHLLLYPQSHNVAPSLPWHRYFIHIFETALRHECGYENFLPYWDWTIDASAPEKSPIWSPLRGFGGNGDVETQCVRNGPFADYEPRFPTPHCIHRNFTSGMNGFNYTEEVIENLWHTASTYHDFRSRLEHGPHKSVHNGIGGEMPTDGSPNDPIFFVHHAQIDRLWWHWQQDQPVIRFKEYFGPQYATGNDTESIQARIMDKIVMLGLDEDLVVLDVMKTESNKLCYRY